MLESFYLSKITHVITSLLGDYLDDGVLNNSFDENAFKEKIYQKVRDLVPGEQFDNAAVSAVEAILEGVIKSFSG
jgi:hypothetical protein